MYGPFLGPLKKSPISEKKEKYISEKNIRGISEENVEISEQKYQNNQYTSEGKYQKNKDISEKKYQRKIEIYQRGDISGKNIREKSPVVASLWVYRYRSLFSDF